MMTRADPILLRMWVNQECQGLPPGLVINVIKHESGYIIGRESDQTTKAFEVLKKDGTSKKINHSYGLMQIAPISLLDYQLSKKEPPIFLEDLQGTDEKSARLQIRLGCLILKKNIAKIQRELQIKDPNEYYRLGLLNYAQGWGKIKELIDILKLKNLPISYQGIKDNFPDFPPIKNKYVEKIIGLPISKIEREIEKKKI